MALALLAKGQQKPSALALSKSVTRIWLSLGWARQRIPTKHAEDRTVRHRIRWTLWLISASMRLLFAFDMLSMLWNVACLL